VSVHPRILHVQSSDAFAPDLVAWEMAGPPTVERTAQRLWSYVQSRHGDSSGVSKQLFRARDLNALLPRSPPQTRHGTSAAACGGNPSIPALGHL